jgi:hypothetical protein
MLMGLINWTDFWIYLIANLLGGVVAAIAFRYLNPDDTTGGALPKLPKISLTRPVAETSQPPS